jgi:hypothetical protein
MEAGPVTVRERRLVGGDLDPTAPLGARWDHALAGSTALAWRQFSPVVVSHYDAAVWNNQEDLADLVAMRDSWVAQLRRSR